ncbi:D-ribose pyranase [Aquibacillus saliphilus]|uniref:D-ribose pyranase n=1 Tax=Aquibacillus saliphilus TaxID=1909422 RepID=UPI001CF07F3A|nr:D-ribose pyranase [Aquibacillus saliphilus]
MKKHGVLNRDISTALSMLGHTDQIVIADCGLPIPNGVKCIDLSVKLGKPSFVEILEMILQDMEVEKLTLAKEIETANQSLFNEMNQVGIPITYVSHEILKETTYDAKAIIRTGENTPYANVILQAGVIF